MQARDRRLLYKTEERKGGRSSYSDFVKKKIPYFTVSDFENVFIFRSRGS